MSITTTYVDGQVLKAENVTEIVANINANETSINGLSTNKVDKVSGKSLISDTTITDLTDTTDTSLHYHSSDRNRSNHTGTQSASTIVQDSSNRLVSDAEKSTWNGKAELASTQLFTQEQHFTENGIAYSDPRPGYDCAIKATGDIATTTQIWAIGNINTTGGQVKVGGNSCYHAGNKPSLVDLGINMGGVSGTPIDISSTDLNNLKTTGFYKGITMTNAPSVNWWYVLCSKHDDAWVYQEVTAFSPTSATSQNMEKYYRVLYSNIWSSWDLVYTSRNKPTLSDIGITTPTVYTPTLLNNWINYDTYYASAGYYKTVEGIVNIQGLIKGGTITVNTVLFTLPVGYRPLKNKIIVGQYSNGTVGVFGSILIFTNGDVRLGGDMSSNIWLSLDGINFPTF